MVGDMMVKDDERWLNYVKYGIEYQVNSDDIGGQPA